MTINPFDLTRQNYIILSVLRCLPSSNPTLSSYVTTCAAEILTKIGSDVVKMTSIIRNVHIGNIAGWCFIKMGNSVSNSNVASFGESLPYSTLHTWRHYDVKVKTPSLPAFNVSRDSRSGFVKKSQTVTNVYQNLSTGRLLQSFFNWKVT